MVKNVLHGVEKLYAERKETDSHISLATLDRLLES